MDEMTILEVLVVLRALLQWAELKAKAEGYTQADLDAADSKREEAIRKLLQTNPPASKGLMLAVEMDADAGEAAQFLFDNGVLVNAVRPNTVRILPPYIIERRHADRFVKLLGRFLDAGGEEGARR